MKLNLVILLNPKKECFSHHSKKIQKCKKEKREMIEYKNGYKGEILYTKTKKNQSDHCFFFRRTSWMKG